MTHSYDPKVVALTALGLACFAFGFSVTAVAYPRVALETPHSAAAPHAKNTTRGCQLGR
jgi:hypothetical protein